MHWSWYLAVAVTALGAGLVGWSIVDLRRQATDLAESAERFRTLGGAAADLGRDARRVRARLATVEARAASGRRPGAG